MPEQKGPTQTTCVLRVTGTGNRVRKSPDVAVELERRVR